MDITADVPILTQSENWALFYRPKSTVISQWFQSSPSPKTGRYIACFKHLYLPLVPILTQSENWALSADTFTASAVFSSNPHPVRKLGAIASISDGNYTKIPVPILTQSENWALSLIFKPLTPESMFQSSPSPKTGRY